MEQSLIYYGISRWAYNLRGKAMDTSLIAKLKTLGKLEAIASTGIDPRTIDYALCTKRTLVELFSPIAPQCHKGHFGHVLVFEGHPQYLGASRLAAYAALRVGAGLLTIATDQSTDPTALDIPEFMRIKTADITDIFLHKINALVIGPGLSRHEAWQQKALVFLNRLSGHSPLILCDADALPLLLHPRLSLSQKTIIATPHAKEAADLLGLTTQRIENDPRAALEQLAHLPCNQKNNIIWLLKGPNTLVRDLSGTVFSHKGELPLLSTGGMGDILSGAIAGLVKQTDCPLCSALLAVSLQIESASVLSKSVFKGILARELADMFPNLTRRP